MNWKQFLKPDWRKFYLFSVISFFFIQYAINGKFSFIDFIVFIVGIPLFIVAIPLFSYLTGAETFKIVAKPKIFATTIALFYLLINFLLYLHDSNHLFYEIPAIVLLIPSYLIPCLLVWIYDKFRKKKEIKLK